LQRLSSALGPRFRTRNIRDKLSPLALEIISDEAHWTRSFTARTSAGHPCACFDPSASKFCAIGALIRATGELLGEPSFERAYEAEKHVLLVNRRPADTLPFINDVEGREAVVAMFEVALARKSSRQC
jgi:hypothetical protein